MKRRSTALILAAIVLLCSSPVLAQRKLRTYRLNSVDLKQPIIWGSECLEPEGSGLSFGGQDQNADDGRPHTRILVDGKWTPIHEELRKANPLQKLHDRLWKLCESLKQVRARSRSLYFRGLPTEEEKMRWRRDVVPAITKQIEELETLAKTFVFVEADEYSQGQIEYANRKIHRAVLLLKLAKDGWNGDAMQDLWNAQSCIELAAEFLDAEPPARAMNCGTAKLPSKETGPENETLVFDWSTKQYFLFGGDHLDYLTNDTWAFDPAKRRWLQMHPEGAPPPRANHRLYARGDGFIRLWGGYTYASNTDYLGGQYVDFTDGEWLYNIERNEWWGGELLPADTRVYRTGPFHPDYYLRDPIPNAAEFEAWLKALPANEWKATNPPHLPRLNRDWGTARIDPSRDIMLRWSGGHSAHGGTDVLHYHFATNRWELPFPVEFPLGQLYSNTSYPNGFNFNKRPWMTGHTYQNYDYDPPSKTMVKAGRPRHYYIYDPDVGDWVGRGKKPPGMQYNSCFYDLTLAATPHGVVSWGKNGKVFRYDYKAGDWNELKLTGDKLAGSYVDNSSMVYDSRRDRLLIFNTHGYGKPFGGQIHAIELKTNRVQTLTPTGSEFASQFANIDKTCYDAENDLVLFGAYLKDQGDHTPTPAYDCKGNRWVTLNLAYATGEKLRRTTRAFPHTRSDGLMFDPTRKLIWGTNTNGQVYVLRIDLGKANVTPLQ